VGAVIVTAIARARVRPDNARGRTSIVGRIPQDQTRIVVRPETFGERLLRLRHEQSLSQDGLAALTGLARQTVSNCEDGRPGVTAHTVALLARALGVSMQRLWEGTEGCSHDAAQ
jgi:DNA-binding XRE family transcriptional regulator